MAGSVVERLERERPATEASLRDLEKLAGRALPADYLDFLRASDGAAGWVRGGDALPSGPDDDPGPYLELWGAHTAIDITTERRANGDADTLLFFGGDGSQEMLAFDFAVDPPEIVLLEITYESVESSPWRIPSFTALLDHLATKDLFDPPG